MGKRGQQSAEKRRIDKMRQEKQAAKRERRHGGGPEGSAAGSAPGEAVDTEALMERFRLLSEAHAAGTVSDEDFEPARHELMVALGVEEPRDPDDQDDADD
jgi:hypothetical protein